MAAATVYQVITDRILERLESGVVPWRIPWSSSDPFPRNLLSNAPYRGINAFLTQLERHVHGYRSPYFLTFKQATSIGGTIKRGEHGTPIVFWQKREHEVEDDEGESETKTMWVARYYTVFNLEQTIGIEREDESETAFHHDPIEQAEQVVVSVPNPPTIVTGYHSACYLPASDEIRTPKIESFPKAEDYYATLFHELGHSTGHPKRLNRRTLADVSHFGSYKYGREELVVEMTAAFLCGHTGIIDSTIDNNVAYLDGWIKKIKGDPRLVVEAAGAAQRAADYLLGKQATEAAQCSPADH